jgi:dihydrofolate reductase
MAKVRVHSLSMSLDGYVAGPDQSLENPIGIGGMAVHEWVFQTRFGRAMIGREGGEDGLDDNFARRREVGVGASIMGRNMFGPIRGPWGDEDWRGWWGPNPPFHHPVFVLTHHPRPPLEMEGGTTFHFVEDPIEQVLESALEAARGQDVLIGGGASTVRQYLAAGLIDEMHLVIAPVLLGSGERLFDDIGVDSGQYRCVEHVCSSAVTHVRFEKV